MERGGRHAWRMTPMPGSQSNTGDRPKRTDSRACDVSVDLKVRVAAANAATRHTVFVVRNTVPALAETLPLGGSRPGGRNLRDRTGLNLSGYVSARDSLLKLSIACIGKILVSGGDRTPPHICREALCLGRLLSKVEIVQVAFV